MNLESRREAKFLRKRLENWGMDFDNISFSDIKIDSKWKKYYNKKISISSISEDNSSQEIKGSKVEKKSNKRFLSYESINEQNPLAKYLIIFNKKHTKAEIFKIENAETRKKLFKEIKKRPSERLKKIKDWLNNS